MTYPVNCGGYLPKGDPGPPGPPGSVLNSWRGPWSAAMTYVPGDLVYHDGSVYLYGNVAPYSSAGGPLFGEQQVAYVEPEPPDAPWELFARRGSDGDTPGTSLNWRGEWSALETYGEGSVVELDGSAYVAAIDVPPGVEPPAGPWDTLVEKGAQGEPGPPGPAAASHWIGFPVRVTDIPSNNNYRVRPGEPAPGSDTEWYAVHGERIAIKHAGLYDVAISVLGRTAITDEPTPRIVGVYKGPLPIGSTFYRDTGALWHAIAHPPIHRFDVGEYVSFLTRQDAGAPASADVFMSLTWIGA